MSPRASSWPHGPRAGLTRRAQRGAGSRGNGAFNGSSLDDHHEPVDRHFDFGGSRPAVPQAALRGFAPRSRRRRHQCCARRQPAGVRRHRALSRRRLLRPVAARTARRESMPRSRSPIDEETREDFTVEETTSGNEYRFVSTGPQLQGKRMARLPRGDRRLPRTRRHDCRQRQPSPRRSRGFLRPRRGPRAPRATPIALDTSGPPLRAALAHGVDYLAVLREMRELTGEPLAIPPPAYPRAGPW